MSEKPKSEDCMAKLPLSPGKGNRILVVDDSEVTGLLIASELEEKGFEVQIAESAEEATRLVTKKASRPDLILLDINMPNIDGAQFCRFIKGNSMFAKVKVVFCSGMEEQSLKDMVASCGADGYLCKSQIMGDGVISFLD